MRIRAKSAFAVLASIAVIVVLFLIPLPHSTALNTHIVTSTSIHRSSAVVFDFVTTPGHWPAWHPSSLSVSGQTNHPLDVGERVTEAFRVAGRRGLVVWTVRARDNPRKWSIDGEIDGRFAGTVTYRLAPEATGTRFTRAFTLSRAVVVVRADQRDLPAQEDPVRIGRGGSAPEKASGTHSAAITARRFARLRGDNFYDADSAPHVEVRNLRSSS
jgi:hypothetical protein